ncbi:MAG: DHA2 family efflux MFS transporter permease subunit [Ornithinibacter sp.]
MTGTVTASAHVGRRDASPALVLVIVCAGVVLASLDLFIVNIALPAIAADLGTRDLSALSWVLNGYAIVYASLLVFFGRLADNYRRNLGFLVGVAVFTAASAACALATSVTTLVVFRLLQAAGAALLTPTSLGLVLASFPADRRPGAVRTWTAVGGLAAALGPVLGGLLVAANWRWVFLVNVPVGVIAMLVGWFRLPDIPGHRGPRPDALGTLLATAAVATLTFALVKGNDWGWGAAATWGTLAVSAVLLASFIAHTRRAANPLIDPALFRIPAFAGSTIVAAIFSASFGGMLLSAVLWQQDVWGWSALKSGLAITPGPIMVPLFAFLVAGRLIGRLGASTVIVIGLTCFAAGLSWFAALVSLTPGYLTQLLPGMLLTGVGVGLTLPTVMATGTSPLPAPSFATGSAVITMMRQVGLAIGVALFVAVLATPTSPADQLASFHRGWWVLAATAALGIVPAWRLRSRSHQDRARTR